MSETVRYVGTLHPIKIPEEYNKSLNTQCTYLKGLEELNLPKWFSEEDYYCDEVFLINGMWYYNVQEKQDPEFEFCDVDVLPDGQIHYHTMYYNGGTSTEEMLKEALAKKEW